MSRITIPGIRIGHPENNFMLIVLAVLLLAVIVPAIAHGSELSPAAPDTRPDGITLPDTDAGCGLFSRMRERRANRQQPAAPSLSGNYAMPNAAFVPTRAPASFGACNCPDNPPAGPPETAPIPMGGNFRMGPASPMPASVPIPARPAANGIPAGWTLVEPGSAFYGPFNASSEACQNGSCGTPAATSTRRGIFRR